MRVSRKEAAAKREWIVDVASAELVGAMVMARVVGEPALSAEMHQTATAHLTSRHG